MNARLSSVRRRAGRTLLEMLVAMLVFGMGSLGMWEVIRTTFFLAAKNTGLNMSHVSLQFAVDTVANQLRASAQLIDVATFNGTTFTAVSGPGVPGNAVRFLRALPVSMFVLPDTLLSTYDINNPQDPSSPGYPDCLTPGNTSVKVRFNPTAPNFKNGFMAKELSLDLQHARFFPRFPYLTETVTTGNDPGTKPGLDLSNVPDLSSTALPVQITLTLTSGLPSLASGIRVPSCNQAYLVVESAFAVLNHGTSYAELIYYPDANDITRKNSLTSGLAVSTSGSGQTVFTSPDAPLAATTPYDAGMYKTLQIILPIFQPNLNNSVVRRGGTAALVNIEMTATVEMRRRASF